MGDVPWARHRRALVLDVCHARQWVECVGVDTDDGEPAWEAFGLDECGDVIPDRWLGTLCPTALLPDQCPRCYGTGDTHASGCMVSANLARGVPEFWAPWVMWVTPPDGTHDGLHLYWVRGSKLNHAEVRNEGPTHVGLVALGPNGPTLAPWGKP